jgi:DNA-binding transcriptional ArsR family regulator
MDDLFERIDFRHEDGARHDFADADIAFVANMVSPKRDTVARALATVSRHIAMLRKCGLVTCRKEGRWCHYRRAPLPRRLARMVDLAAPPGTRRGRNCGPDGRRP